MNYIKTLSAVGSSVGIGAVLAVGVAGCGGQTGQQSEVTQQQKQPAFVVIEEISQGRYKIAEEFPAKETRIILKKLDGTERVLTQEELDYLVKKEAAKIEQGTSELTKPQEAQVGRQGMGLGETILASAAGYMLGAWIGSKLFGNPAYQNNRKAGYKSPSTYSRSKSSFKKSAAKRTAAKKGGFFGSKKRSGGFFGGSRRSGGFFGG